MGEGPAYVILGRGRWAKKMWPMIAGEGRSVLAIEETRQRHSESQEAYVSRLTLGMRASRAQIAWLCVTPGPHVTVMIQAAIEAGLHVVAEKPWYGSAEDTKRLQALAVAKGRIIAVHYEYCVLEEVEKWREEFHPGSGMQFGGHFFLSRSDQSGVPPIDNLGCHLLAIREWAVPSSEVSQIECAYEGADERLVWLEKGREKVGSIDLLNHRQLIVQRFMKRVEAALDGAAFPFDLEFGLRVAVELNALKNRK
jgi:predicted dehydrogenase